MKAETADWLRYAEENAAVAKLARREGHLNACAQNVQQCVEKALKATVVELALPFRKTHSITDLRQVLLAAGWDCGFAEERVRAARHAVPAVEVPSRRCAASLGRDPDALRCLPGVGGAVSGSGQEACPDRAVVRTI